MALADLIRGTGAGKGLTVARVATVAVANTQKPESIVESADSATATSATSATVAGLSTADEASIRRWLSLIGETDQHLIEMTIRWCETNRESRDFFLRLAAQTDEQLP